MPKGGSKYTVQRGETLCDIAKKIYGDAALWWMISNANPKAISADGAIISPGAVLDIPVLLEEVWVSNIWTGRIRPWSAALRSAPRRDPAAPHRGILADLPRGTEVKIIDRKGAWLQCEVLLKHKKLTGYVSQEVVDRLPAPPPEVPPSVNPKPQTIGEFILFVEEVEHQYPQADPAKIATEIRQLWFSDTNWELLVAGKGVYDEHGNAVDIETKPNPIAEKFDMKDLAPREGGKQLSTNMGMVDIGHVMAGIDAALNGTPASYPRAFLEERGHHDSDAELKFKTLSDASQGNVSDFTTWSGDLGQAYAEYLVARYIKKDHTATLQAFMKEKAPDVELLGDIHGYIAKKVHESTPPKWRPVCADKVSSILRSMYLAGSPVRGASFQSFMEQVSGKMGNGLRDFIRERSLRFARPWFAKKAYEHQGWWSSSGWGGSGILENGMKEFDKRHTENEAGAKPDDKIDSMVDAFMKMLSGQLK